MNDRQKALWKLQYMDFAIHETVLYLDGHPDNKKALEYYKKAVELGYYNTVEDVARVQEKLKD